MIKNELSGTKPGSVLFIPHGGGPLPLLGEQSHQEMVSFLTEIPQKLSKPSAIVVISAHWEEDKATITSGAAPRYSMIIPVFLLKPIESNTPHQVILFWPIKFIIFYRKVVLKHG